jgi:DNA-directed RNA polymerase beta' subunit
VPHPWLRERTLTEIGIPATAPAAEDGVAGRLFPPGGWHDEVVPSAAFAAVVEANERAARMVNSETPRRLVDDAVAQLEHSVQILFDELLTPSHLRLSERLAFSGRTVLTPGADLAPDQVGLPEAMAWALFGPLVVRELGGDTAALGDRNARAVEALDAVMARSWVIVNRAPTLAPTALLAFHPVRVAGHALQIAPLVCEWLNADFDGDQAAVLLPITADGQREAGAALSVAAHLRRDPGLLPALLPRHDALWGLASLSLRPGGLDEIADLVGAPVSAPRGYVTRGTLGAALQDVMAREGADALLPRLARLTARGFEAAKAAGASLAPWMQTGALLSPAPTLARVGAWETYVDEVAEALTSPADCAPASLGPQCLMVRAAGEGTEQLARLIAGRGAVEGAGGDRVVVDRGYVDGYTPEALFACVAGARRGFAEVFRRWEQIGQTFRAGNVSPSFNVITRALRARHPGVVFARAAAVGEVDPLEDVEARLLVGLPVRGES